MNGRFRLNRALIRVSGADAASFLQGLLTQDVARLADAPLLYAGLLTPQGKLIADMFLWADGESIVIDADPSRRDELMRRLTLYKLRAQVGVEDVSAAHAIMVSDARFEGASLDPRLPAIGWRALTGASPAPDGAEAYAAHNIALGVPDLAVDCSPEEVFALEALFEEFHGVDFQKGCFVGQENVSRMKRRATTRKKFCPIVVEGEAPAFGAPIGAGEAELGSVRSGANGRALALLRLDRALEAGRRGVSLSAGGATVRLDPPAWLLLPDAD